MALETIIVYTTIARVQNVLSVTGVNLRTDDSPPDAYGDAINEACDELDSFLWERYSQEQLSTSDIVSARCANLAAWYLCTRRGNPPPPGLALRVAIVRDWLAKVQAHKMSVPRIAQRKSYAPVMSVMTVNMRPFPRATVEKSRGTGSPANYSNTNSLDPYDKFGANSYMDFSI